jgi:outer membrane protein W
MRRLTTTLATIMGLALFVPATASAQNALNLSIGGFTPRGLDGRGSDDVLFVDSATIATFNQSNGIDVSEFNGATIGAEWLIGLGDNFEGSLGVGYYQRTVPTSYANFTDQSGNEIQQDLKLRIIPFSATVRFLPLGHRSGIVPYIGGGVAVLSYRYTETGRFVDFTDNSIFTDSFEGSGSATGPMIVGGIRVPVGSVLVGGEIRYQNAKGNLPTTGSNSFLASKIDLTGTSYLFTIGFRF